MSEYWPLFNMFKVRPLTLVHSLTSEGHVHGSWMSDEKYSGHEIERDGDCMHISLRERETEMADKHHEERDERLLFNMFLTDWLGSMEEKSVLYVPNNNFSRDARERERIMQLCLGAPCLKAALQISQTIKL